MGAWVAALSPGNFFSGWWVASTLLAISLFFLLWTWTWAGSTRLVGALMTAAFFLRLVGGMALSLALPEFGYDTAPQNAGYPFFDAYKRDQEAWGLVTSGMDFWRTFIQEFDTDQYGGLLVVAGFIYRYLSPDAHRPFLVLILTAFIFAFSVPFFWKAVMGRWGERVAKLAGWIFALYPDGILFSLSLMREPFLIGLSAIAWWAVESWPENRRRAGIVFLAAVITMFFFSTKVTMLITAVLLLWFWLEHLQPSLPSKLKMLGWFGLVLVSLLVLAFTWNWFRVSAMGDLSLTEARSGRVQFEIEMIGPQWRVPFLVALGLAQPVLPAAVAEPSIPLWKGIVIWRAVGWYMLAPFLLYSLFIATRMADGQARRLWWLIIAVTIFWLVVSSARGGGDQTDNPRYRVLFLQWMAVLAAAGLVHACQTRDAWLGRWLLVEVVFLVFFTYWYLSRYYQFGPRIMFWSLVAWITGLSFIILTGGWVQDRLKKR